MSGIPALTRTASSTRFERGGKRRLFLALVLATFVAVLVSVGTALVEPAGAADTVAGLQPQDASSQLSLAGPLGLLTPFAEVAHGALTDVEAGFAGPATPPAPSVPRVSPYTAAAATAAATPIKPVAAATGAPPAALGPVAARCEAARNDVAARGLVLPAPFEYRCPGSTELEAGARQHWGTTCARAPLCPSVAYIAVNPGLIGPSEARIRYVVAHEICHALDVAANRPLSEPGADACAKAHGFPRV